MEQLEQELPFKAIFGIKTIKYRIVEDCYAGFECQKWRIYYPFWIQMDFVNSYLTIEKAIKYINKKNGTVVLSS